MVVWTCLKINIRLFARPLNPNPEFPGCECGHVRFEFDIDLPKLASTSLAPDYSSSHSSASRLPPQAATRPRPPPPVSCHPSTQSSWPHSCPWRGRAMAGGHTPSSSSSSFPSAAKCHGQRFPSAAAALAVPPPPAIRRTTLPPTGVGMGAFCAARRLVEDLTITGVI